MAVTKFLARDLTIGIDAGGSGGPFTPIKGINTITHAPANTDADTTDFDSAGHNEHMVAERGDTWTLAGFSLEDVLTGAKDSGQAAVELLAQGMSTASLAWFQIVTPGGNKLTFSASAVVTLHGGGNNVAATWQAVLHASGATTFS